MKIEFEIDEVKKIISEYVAEMFMESLRGKDISCSEKFGGYTVRITESEKEPNEEPEKVAA